VQNTSVTVKNSVTTGDLREFDLNRLFLACTIGGPGSLPESLKPCLLPPRNTLRILGDVVPISSVNLLPGEAWYHGKLKPKLGIDAASVRASA